MFALIKAASGAATPVFARPAMPTPTAVIPRGVPTTRVQGLPSRDNTPTPSVAQWPPAGVGQQGYRLPAPTRVPPAMFADYGLAMNHDPHVPDGFSVPGAVKQKAPTAPAAPTLQAAMEAHRGGDETIAAQRAMTPRRELANRPWSQSDLSEFHRRAYNAPAGAGVPVTNPTDLANRMTGRSALPVRPADVATVRHANNLFQQGQNIPKPILPARIKGAALALAAFGLSFPA